MRKNGKDISCEWCGTSVYKKASLLKKNKHHYCSSNCQTTALNHNRTPWNKGTIGLMKPNSGSFKKGEHRSVATEFKGKPWTFNGTVSEYKKLHSWITKKLGRPRQCEMCGNTDSPVYHWANKSRKYLRELTDWIRLCPGCHFKYDGRKTNA